MPWKSVSPIEIYKLLPRTNCQKCGEENCMAFAAKLVNMEVKLEKCTPMLEDAKYREAFEKIWNFIKPPVQQVTVRRGERVVNIGGEYVTYRHDMTYVNPPPVAIDIDDEMSEEEMVRRAKLVDEFTYNYVGINLKLDMVALRSVSDDPEKYRRALKVVHDNTTSPLMLCSLNPKVIAAGLQLFEGERPIIYAATTSNWIEMSDLALKFGCPLAIYSPGDMDSLSSLAQTLRQRGINDLLLDPGTFVGEGFVETMRSLTALRWKSCEEGDELSGFPVIGVPLTAWLTVQGDVEEKARWEAVTAAALIMRYASLLVIHSTEGWGLLPLVMLKQNMYTDPRKPIAVSPGLRTLGNPGEWSPVFVTGNFVLTYYIVSGDIESAKIESFLLVADSEGMAIDAAVAGKKLTADKIAEALKASELEKRIKHRVLVIPGKSARLSGETEEATGWKVVVGPAECSEIASFVKDKWPGVLEEWKKEQQAGNG
jgi:acetyl-CoA decarbonylase/synthase complex subunit gamma